VDGNTLEGKLEEASGLRRGGIQRQAGIPEGAAEVWLRNRNVRKDQRQGLLGGEDLETNRILAHLGVCGVKNLVQGQGGLPHIDVENRGAGRLRGRALHALVVHMLEHGIAADKLGARERRRRRSSALGAGASGLSESVRRSSRLRLRRRATGGSLRA